MYCLIVEDERQTREGLSRLVKWQRIGIDRVAYAVDGREALASIRRDPPDLVLCDIRMPHMNGVELLTRLREEGNNVPLIFMSGYSDKEYLMAAIRYRAVDYIEKPISIPVLTNALVKVVESLDAERVQVDPHLAGRMVRPGSDFHEIRARLEAIGHGLAQVSVYFTAWLIKPQDSPGMPFRQLRFLLHDWKWPALSDEETARHQIVITGSVSGEMPDFNGLLARINMIGGGYTLSVGPPVHALDMLPTAMDQARHTAQRVFFRGDGLVYETLPSDHRANRAAAECQLRLYECLKNHHYPAIRDHLSALTRQWQEAEGIYPEDAFDMLEQLRDSLLKNALSRFRDQIMTDALMQDKWLAVLGGKRLSAVMASFQAWLDALVERYLAFSQHSPAVMRALRYIGDHYAEHFSTDDLARVAFVSTSHLSYLFRQEMGLTIKQYVTDVRMEKARCMLRDPSVRLSEIPGLVGIEDASYFAKLFRKAEGMTPSAFRERNPS